MIGIPVECKQINKKRSSFPPLIGCVGIDDVMVESIHKERARERERDDDDGGDDDVSPCKSR